MLLALLSVFSLHLDSRTIELTESLIEDFSYATITVAVELDHHLDQEQFGSAQLL